MSLTSLRFLQELIFKIFLLPFLLLIIDIIPFIDNVLEGASIIAIPSVPFSLIVELLSLNHYLVLLNDLIISEVSLRVFCT